MKKFILYLMSAIIGVSAGILLHCSFMLVEAKGCYMLPTIEPEQKVIINLIDKEITTGDVVAFYPPYYTLNGEGNIVFRRVKDVQEEQVLLVCDTGTTEDSETKLNKEDILGKAVFLEKNRR